MRLVGNESTAEEVVNEVFLEAGGTRRNSKDDRRSRLG
jgi:hypothetical protein